MTNDEHHILSARGAVSPPSRIGWPRVYNAGIIYPT